MKTIDKGGREGEREHWEQKAMSEDEKDWLNTT